ncbi:hypothetical protein LSAT2_016052 [Lamellibrachia satsuma]|nr:hypothetical protein LSAT2_016052 [Lamellibrachia satsuma]
MKELEVLLEELRLLVVAMVGREQGGCASSSGGGTVGDKVGKDTRDARESSPQPGRKLRGGKVTGRKETGKKGTGGKTTRVKERGVGETGGKEKGVGETGGKTTGVKERGVVETRAKEREVGETGAKETGGKGSGQNVMEGIERKSYSAAVIEGVRKRARVFVGDSIVRKTDRVLNKGDDVVVCLPGAKIEAITERVENIVGSVHKMYKYSLPESEILDLAEKICDSKTYESYGLKLVDDKKRLTGPGTEVENRPGVMQGGGKWPIRMSDMCNTYMENIGETEIYEEYKRNKKSRSGFVNYLCYGSGVLGKCSKIKDEL